MSSSGGDTSVITSIISSDGSNNWQIIIALMASSVGFIVAIVNSIAAYFRDKKHMEELAAQERRFEAFKKELEDKQRRLVRFENVQELMKQYKKPLLQSAFDLQSRLANQVKSNFLYQFNNKGNDRDREYARLNMAYVISEFLGWLEVIRQEIVFIVGDGNRTSDLNLIIDAIKFQFTGDTPVQGNGQNGDVHWQILQLYAGELRAIGEVMLVERSYDDENVGSNMSVIGYAEFVRRLTMEPPDGSSTEEMATWKTSKEKLQREILSPLLSYIDSLMDMNQDVTPKRRMVMLQVLLCKLIDVLDDAVPYEVGPEFNLEVGEEPRYIPRDFRLTPLVSWLSAEQRKYLSEQRFMEKVKDVDLYAWRDWWTRLLDLPEDEREMYARLCFPGFREDKHRTRDGLMTQRDRESSLRGDGFPGAFPPREPRPREQWWWDSQTAADQERWYQEAARKGRQLAQVHLHRTHSARHDGGKSGWSWPLLRNRRRVSPAVGPEPAVTKDYDSAGGYQPAVLTSPSVHQLRAGVRSQSVGESGDATPVSPMSNPRAAAGL